MKHPEVPEALRGSYAGLGHPAAIAHLKNLGVTAVELLPVHEFADDGFLEDKSLRNYWGYSTLGYFAPEQRYMSSRTPGAQVAEFKAMVKALHAAGLEVILDVVYNHTCEGNHLGPTLSLRGIDNAGYYWLMPDARYYLDFTGTGNSLNASNPETARLIVDSLRYWVGEMHVDGFRFDLATTVGRAAHASLRSLRADLPDHQPGSGAVAREADRRAVGHRHRRLPGRQLSRAVRRVERQVPRCPAPLLEGRRQPGVGDRLSPHRLGGSVRRRSARAAGQHQLPDRARRLHAARPRHLRRQAQRSQRRARPGRRRRQPVVEPRRRGRDRRRGHHRAARAAEAQPAGDAVPVAGRADVAGRRRDRPHPARQQQRLLPGQRDLLVRLDARRSAAAPAGFHAPPDQAAPAAPGAAAPALLRGRLHLGVGLEGPGVAAARRRGDDAHRLADALDLVAGVHARRRRAAGGRRARGAPGRRRPAGAAQRAPRADHLQAAGGGRRRRLAGAARHRGSRRRRPTRRPRANTRSRRGRW